MESVAGERLRMRRSRASWVMGALTAVAAVVCVGAPSWAAGMKGAIRIPSGGYLYTADAPDLTDATEGLTIEAWLRRESFPGDNTDWPVITKGGSHAIVIYGRDLSDPLHNQPGGVWLSFPVYSPDEGPSSGVVVSFGPGAPRAWTRSVWVNVAHQIQDNGDSTMSEPFFDGESLNPRGAVALDFGMGRADTPLCIGGADLDDGPCGWWTKPEHTVGGMDVWIDEVRISRGLRLSGVRGGPDRSTIALWTFDDSPPYEDASGNGHTLFPAGSLGVTARGRLTTTWAQLKRP